jgi:protease-4
MRIFLKSFLAALLALVVFTIIFIIVLFGWITRLASTQKTETGSNAVVYIDLGQNFHEQEEENPLASIGRDNQYDHPGVYDMVRLIHYAKGDSAIKGIYLRCNDNPNGFATSEEIRDALLDFKQSGKFLIAYGDVIPQKAYYVGSVADKIYCNPKGGVDWVGFASRLPFLKTALQKLEIDPQIFYAGKFKSATEPLREDKMTDANRIQTSELLNGLYDDFLWGAASARGLDTSILRKCVNEHLIRSAKDAMNYNLVDGLKYDDEVRAEISERLKIGSKGKINFISIARYASAVEYKQSGKDRIALIYAEGDIVGGEADQQQIGDETYRKLIRAARLDDDVKAIVLRINSGGGSSLASENLWRELTIARKQKPVVISFGDVAASGAYYLSCNADSIFAQPTTITGSIGVFSILPNLQSFFKDKLGVSFDGVKTAPDADALTITKPLTDNQRKFFQSEVDSIYTTFKSRVAHGRKKSMEYIDSIAQGRVWSGRIALELGLVDRLGSLQDAIDCAARMARISSYRLREYPEAKNIIDQLLSSYKRSIHTKAMQEELGAEGVKTYKILQRVKSMMGTVQARMPVDLEIE